MPDAHDADVQIAAVAATQRRLITHAQLRATGLGQASIDRRLTQGRLFRVLPGVYIVGVPLLDRAMLSLAGLLFAGPRSFLSLTSAAEAWGLLDPHPAAVSVARPGRRLPLSVRTRTPIETGGFGLVHVRQGTRHPFELGQVSGVPTPTVARTLVDLAAYRPHLFDRAWRQAEFRRVLDVGELETQLAGSRRKGNALVRAKLAEHIEIDAGPHGYDSLSELDAVKLVVAAGTPHPLVNHWVTAAGRPRRLDLFFEHAMLAIEVDDWDGHSTRTAFEDDPVRDSDLRTIGIETRRYTVRKLTREPEWCARRILDELDRRVEELAALRAFRRAA